MGQERGLRERKRGQIYFPDLLLPFIPTQRRPRWRTELDPAPRNARNLIREPLVAGQLAALQEALGTGLYTETGTDLLVLRRFTWI